MEIGLFRHTDAMFGGSVYEKMVARALSTEHNVSWFDTRARFRRAGVRPQMFLSVLRKQLTSRIDLWIRNDVAVAAMIKRDAEQRNVALCHHIDPTEIGNRTIGRGLHRLFIRNAKRCDCVIVVAQFWKDYLESQGVERVRVIHNGFDVPAFDVHKANVDRFKEEHGLLGKPIIYVGNCQESKGAREVLEVLRPLDAHFVSSGIKNTQLPVRHFRMPYREYILLLSAADVVITMSKFLEGWNRVAHEAMLCRTPVVGSGLGGMRELLDGGGQLTAKTVSDLPEKVAFALRHSASLGKRGHSFASQFTRERFAENWLELLSTV